MKTNKCVSCIKDQATGECYDVKDKTAREQAVQLTSRVNGITETLMSLPALEVGLEQVRARITMLENAPSGGGATLYNHAISFGAEGTNSARYKVLLNVSSTRDTAYVDDGKGSFIDDIVHMLPLPVTLSGLLTASMSGFGVMYGTGDIICINPNDGTFINFTPKTSSAGIWSFKDTLTAKTEGR